MQPRVIKGFDPAPPGKYIVKKALVDSDFDGCVCAAILLNVYPGIELNFSDPASVQAGKVSAYVDSETLIADLPYIAGCGLWFDHHLGNVPETAEFPGRCGNTNCAAELLYDYFRDIADLSKFAQIIPELGKFDFAVLTMDEVKHPNDYIRIGFAMDRKDVEFIRLFANNLAQYNWQEVMAMPEVVAKLTIAETRQQNFLEYLKTHTQITPDNIAFLDNREFKDQVPHSFFVYTIFPDIDGVVMISGAPGKIKFSLYRNNFKPDAKDINFLAIARALNPEFSGGHKWGCGFVLPQSMSVEEAIAKITALINNSN